MPSELNVSSNELKSPSLVIFDLDGTIVDSAADIQVAANNLFSALELPEQPLNQIKRWIGGGAQVFVEKALDHFGRSEWYDRSYDIFMDFYRAVPADRAVVYDGVRGFIEHLDQLGVPMALVSNKPQELIRPIMKHLKLEQYFECFLGGDSLPQKKPDPTPLQHVCQQLNVPVEHSWMIGDSSKDADAAEAAGMPFVGVRYGYALMENDLRPQHIPHILVDNLEELIPMLKAESDIYA